MAEILAGDVLARLRADASQFNQVMQQTVQRLGQLTQATAQIRAQQTQSTQSTQQLTQSLQAQSRAVEQSSSAWRGMLQVAGGIGVATGVGALVSQLKDLAVSTVQTGTRLESLRASLAALGGGAGAGVQQFQMLTGLAQQLGVALEPLARGWRNLTAAATQAGLPLADQQRLLTALATEGRRVGASQEELGRAILAVGQMASKGKVSMEELRQQLGEALPTALAAASQGMGKTTEELTKLVETGRMSFAPFAQALTRGFEQMQRASGAFTEGSREALTRLGTAWKILQDRIMQSGVNTYLVQVAKNLEEAVKWTTKLFSSPTPGLDLSKPSTGASQAQRQEEGRLERLIALYEREVAAGSTVTPGMQAMVARAKEQLAQIQAAIEATNEQAVAQKKVTEETNKTLDVQARQKAFNDEFAKATAQIAKDTAAFRAEAALAPSVKGRPAGTTDEVTTYNKNLQEIVGKQVESLAALAAQRGQDIQLTNEQRQALAAYDTQYGTLGATITRVHEAESAAKTAAREALQEAQRAVREAEQADREAARDRMQTLREIAAEEERNLAILRQLAAQYGQTKQARDIDTAHAAMAALGETHAANRAEAQGYFTVIQDVARIEAQIVELRRQAAASAPAGIAALAQAQDTQSFESDLANRLDQLRTPREERESTRLRQRAERQGITLTPALDAQLKLIDTQARWNTIMEQSLRLGDQMAQSLTSGLLSIVDGTQAVGEGFKAMAKSILDSLAQILVSEGLKVLIRLGLTALGGAIAPSAGASTGVGTSASYLSAVIGRRYQHGGTVNHPTLALLGENPAMNPEYVLNRPQMQAMMQAGGQNSNTSISIINVSSREQGEQRAASERAMGKQVVLNYIMDDLSQGSGSAIGRLIRAGGA